MDWHESCKAVICANFHKCQQVDTIFPIEKACFALA